MWLQLHTTSGANGSNGDRIVVKLYMCLYWYFEYEYKYEWYLNYEYKYG